MANAAAICTAVQTFGIERSSDRFHTTDRLINIRHDLIDSHYHDDGFGTKRDRCHAIASTIHIIQLAKLGDGIARGQIHICLCRIAQYLNTLLRSKIRSIAIQKSITTFSQPFNNARLIQRHGTADRYGSTFINHTLNER